MLVVPLLFVLIPLGISLLAPTWRVAALTSVMGAVVAWILIARFTYVSPIPLNEPEWWAGLAIVCTLAGIGVTLGAFIRRRQTSSIAD